MIDPTEATRAVPCSHNYNFYDCCRCPASVLTVYKEPTDYCRCDATLQIDRESLWGLTRSCDTRTDANLRDNYLSMSGSDPSHREVGRQTVSCTTCTIMPTTRHPHTRAALISSAGQHPAWISAAHWSQTHSGPFKRLNGVVASRL